MDFVFSRSAIKNLFNEAKAEQSSITRLTDHLLPHFSQIDVILETWGETCADAYTKNDSDRQLVLLYIANHLVQSGIRKFGRAFAASFELPIQNVLDLIFYQNTNPHLLKCAKKTIQVWKDRQIFSESMVKSLNRIMRSAESSSSSVPPQQQPSSRSNSKISRKDLSALQKTTTPNKLGKKRRSSSSSASKPKVPLSPHEFQSPEDAAKFKTLLGKIPEETHSGETLETLDIFQQLSSAVATSELMHDQMMKLKDGLESFESANASHHEEEEDEDHDDDQEKQQKLSQKDLQVMEELDLEQSIFDSTEHSSTSQLKWKDVDDSVLYLESEKAFQHVQQYREALERVNEKREQVMSHVRNLKDFEQLSKPSQEKQTAVQDQIRRLEDLFVLVNLAETLEEDKKKGRRSSTSTSPANKTQQHTGPSHSEQAKRQRQFGPDLHRNKMNHHQSYDRFVDQMNHHPTPAAARPVHHDRERPPLHRRQTHGPEFNRNTSTPSYGGDSRNAPLNRRSSHSGFTSQQRPHSGHDRMMHHPDHHHPRPQDPPYFNHHHEHSGPGHYKRPSGSPDHMHKYGINHMKMNNRRSSYGDRQ